MYERWRLKHPVPALSRASAALSEASERLEEASSKAYASEDGYYATERYPLYTDQQRGH